MVLYCGQGRAERTDSRREGNQKARVRPPRPAQSETHLKFISIFAEQKTLSNGVEAERFSPFLANKGRITAALIDLKTNYSYDF